ncbi:MAG: cytochrome c [Planctomycetaceae bacterium]
MPDRQQPSNPPAANRLLARHLQLQSPATRSAFRRPSIPTGDSAMNNYVWKLLITGLACTLAALPADEPPDSSSMERLMQQKMAVAQQAFEAVARGNFQDTSQTANRLIALSRQELWQQMASPRFVQDTVDFVRAVELLDRMATAKDSDGTALAFTKVTLSCTNCHEHIRGARTAQLDRPLSDAKQLTASRF